MPNVHLEHFLKSLTDYQVKIINVEFVKPYEKHMVWESEDQTKHFLELFKCAKKEKGVVLDGFYVYKK